MKWLEKKIGFELAFDLGFDLGFDRGLSLDLRNTKTLAVLKVS